MSTEPQAATPVPTISPFLGGDPIVDEDLGDVSDLHSDLAEVIPGGADDAPAPATRDPVPADEPADEPAPAPVAAAPVEEPAPAAVPAPAPAEPAVKPPIMIPKGRFDEVNEARKAAERRLRELELKQRGNIDTKGQVNVQLNPGERLKQHAKLILDGKEDEAAALMQEILIEASTEAARTAVSQVRGTIEQVNTEQTMNSLIDEIESSIPQMNPQDTENFDQDLVNTVLQFHSVYSRKMSPAQAMEKAVFVAIQAERPELFASLFGETEEVAAPAPQAPVAPVAPPVKPPVAAVKKNIAAATAQPPATVMAPNASESTLPKIAEMTDEEFAALPASTKRKLRGDNM